LKKKKRIEFGLVFRRALFPFYFSRKMSLITEVIEKLTASVEKKADPLQSVNSVGDSLRLWRVKVNLLNKTELSITDIINESTT